MAPKREIKLITTSPMNTNTEIDRQRTQLSKI